MSVFASKYNYIPGYSNDNTLFITRNQFNYFKSLNKDIAELFTNNIKDIFNESDLQNLLGLNNFFVTNSFIASINKEAKFFFNDYCSLYSFIDSELHKKIELEANEYKDCYNKLNTEEIQKNYQLHQCEDQEARSDRSKDRIGKCLAIYSIKSTQAIINGQSSTNYLIVIDPVKLPLLKVRDELKKFILECYSIKETAYANSKLYLTLLKAEQKNIDIL